MKKTILTTGLCGLMLAAAGTMRADGDGGPPDHVYARFAQESGVSVAVLKAQQQATGLGFGALRIANRLAAATGQSFEQIVLWHKEGHGWGEIARANNLSLGQVLGKAPAANPGR